MDLLPRGGTTCPSNSSRSSRSPTNLPPPPLLRQGSSSSALWCTNRIAIDPVSQVQNASIAQHDRPSRLITPAPLSSPNQERGESHNVPDDTDEDGDIVPLPSREMNPLLHRPLLERGRHGPRVLIHRLGAQTKRLRDDFGREPIEGKSGWVRRRYGRGRRWRGGPYEAEHFFEDVLVEEVVD